MLITMNTVYAGNHPATGSPLTLRPDEVAEFPEDVAADLIAGGYAFDHVAQAAKADAELQAKRDAKAAAEADAAGGDKPAAKGKRAGGK